METREVKRKSAPEPVDPLVGAVIDDRYTIVDAIGGGGVGTVYRANDSKLDRSVALKVLHEQLVSVETLGKRFEQEARILASLRHPNIVTVMDYGVFEVRPYFVMELLEGRSLRDRLSEGLPDSEEAVAVIKQTLRGLAYAHAKGIAHRDLKPDNVFLQSIGDDEVHVRLLDFGFAKLLTEDSADGAALTRAGQVFGTPAYMAPEQASAAPTDARTDVYAVGIMLYELAAGRRPFEGPAPEVLKQHLIADVPPISTFRADRAPTPALDAVLARALAKDPDQRYADASVMLTAIDELELPIFRPEPKETQRAWPVTQAMAPVAPPRKMPMLVPAIAAGAVVIVSLLACLVVVVATSAEPDEAVTTQTNDETPAEPQEVEEAVQAPVQDEYPWTEPIPEALARTKALLDGGRVPSGSSDSRLRTYARQNPRDGRAPALLGRTYLARGWRPDAIEEYEKALELTPNLVTDEATLQDVITLGLHSATHRRATVLLARHWGATARPYVERRRGVVHRDDVGRLNALLEALPAE
jgi:serine/threonine-protein kinase